MNETYHEVYSRLSEGWHLLQRAIDEDIFFINQHSRTRNEELLSFRLQSYLTHVRDLTRIEEDMTLAGIGFANVTELRMNKECFF